MHVYSARQSSCSNVSHLERAHGVGGVDILEWPRAPRVRERGVVDRRHRLETQLLKRPPRIGP